MTNGERVQQALNIDNDCVDVWGENGKMFFSVTQEWWFKESGNRGEWVEDSYGDYECSECHIKRNSLMKGNFNFCPHCGSDMRKEFVNVHDCIYDNGAYGEWGKDK